LLGEAVDENDNETIQDGVAELCNIITGGSKTLFSKKGVKILFELPQTFLSCKDLSAEVGVNNGVWIHMELDSKPFYMFITK
jgi:CheY-specific phosphatase CheX